MKQLKLTAWLAFFAGVLFLTGCGNDDDSGTDVTLPSNLVTTVTLDEEVEGRVTVTATADLTNFYTITFSEDGETTVEENNEGSATYTYSTEGSYTIVVRAHATQDQYTEEVVTVDIEFSDPTTGGDGLGGYETPLSYAGYDLVWQDEFDGSSLNTNDWNYETGTGSSGWGNNELQYYREQNTTVGNGVLVIEAKAENFGGSAYTSSRLTTQGKQEFQYGRIDIRANMPQGQGLWPALWMLGSDFSTAGWPFCGEIDIMEMVGGVVQDGGDNVVHGTVHWDNDNSYANFGGSRTIASGVLADNYHVYSVTWDATAITWFIDDVQYHIIDITPAPLSEFHQPFFFIFNVAVGGNWPGSPDATSTFPQRMTVDYVRVFQKQ